MIDVLNDDIGPETALAEFRPLVSAGHAGLEVVEQGVQAVPQVLQADDDADGDDGGDEAIFDGGRTGLVLHKAGENSLHDNTLPVMVRTAHL